MKILLCDDDFVILELLKALFEQSSHIFTVTSSANEAINILKNSAYDVLIIDLQLPDLSGPDVIKEIRSNPINKHIKTVVASANEDAEKITLKAGVTADLFLLKPYNLKELIPKIEQLI